MSDDEKLRSRIGVDILPKEFGGTVPMSEMTAAWKAELIANRSRLMALDSLKVSKESDPESGSGGGGVAQKERKGFLSFFHVGSK